MPNKDTHSDASNEREQEQFEQVSPDRAFYQGAGTVLGFVGTMLFLSGCCWSSIACTLERGITPTSADGIVSIMHDAPSEKKWALASYAITLTGGLAMCVLGIGLRHDRRGAAISLIVVTACAAVMYWCYLVWAIFWMPGAGRIILAGLMAVIWTMSFLLAGAAGSALKRSPPPIDAVSTLSSSDEDDLRRAASLRSRDRTNR